MGVDFARDPGTDRPRSTASVRICGRDCSTRSAIFTDVHEVRGTRLAVTDDCERKLFVGGFKDTPAEVVRDHFALFGELEEFDAAVRDQNGKPRGYAFVRFVRQEVVDRVLAQPEHIINGRTCTVRQAEARPVPVPKGGAGGASGGPSSRLRSPSPSPRQPCRRQSRSRSGDGSNRRRSRAAAGRGRGKGGLQVAPGYEYKDGVGAQPGQGYMPPGGRPAWPLVRGGYSPAPPAGCSAPPGAGTVASSYGALPTGWPPPSWHMPATAPRPPSWWLGVR